MNTEPQSTNRIARSFSFTILIFIGLFLLANTNNNPNAIIQRVLRPIHIGTGTIYYAALIPILIIYYSLKGIYKQNNYVFLSTRLRRIIVMVLILSILPTCSESGTKLYKRFYNDLNSIYCYRNNMNLSIRTIDNERKVVCKVELENCSSKSQEFLVKIFLPNLLIEANESTFVNKDTLLVLAPYERRQFESTFSESSVKRGSYTFTDVNIFEFALYNGLQEVKFTHSD